MKNNFLRQMLILLPCFLSFSAFATLNKKSKEPSVENLKQKISAIQNESMMPGLEVMVTENAKEIFSYTSGVRAIDKGVQVTSNDKWHIGSCTKPMTAFLIGILVDQGKLNWNSKLKDIVPKNQKMHSSLDEITIEQLLSHSSGLADVVEPDKGKLWATLFTKDKSSKEMRSKLVSGILSLPAHFTPGSKHEYSNSGYVVLGWIAEQLLNNDWESIIKEKIFYKLDMKSCGFGSPGAEDQLNPKQPWGHALNNVKLISLAPGIQSDNPPAFGPAGTVHCNAQDWRKFSSLYLTNQPNPLVFKSTLEKLLSNADKESLYTFSTIERMEREWAHGTVFAMAGSNTFNYAVLAIAPNLGRIYTINTNADHQKAEAGAYQILKLLTEIK
ncbi:MAG: serine hydrolase domain-containing protein [Bdellovibrio sp.]